MRVLSHRGRVSEGVPENTLEAFEAAVRAGVDGIETDIHATRDGELVLFHDRLTTGGRPVASLSRRELEAAVGHGVPVLAEALGAWPELFWNLEVKAADATEATLAFLAGRSFPGGALVTSFLHDVVAYFAERSDLACGILVAHRPLSVSTLLSDWRRRSRMRAVVWDFNACDPAVLAETRRSGYESYVYAVESVEDHRRCLSLPLEGVITNHPERILDLVKGTKDVRG